MFDELEAVGKVRFFPRRKHSHLYHLDPELQNYLETLADASETDKLLRFGQPYARVQGIFYRRPDQAASRFSDKALSSMRPRSRRRSHLPRYAHSGRKDGFRGYEPKNFSGTYSGYISVRESLAERQYPRVKILNSTGVSKAAEYMKNSGWRSPRTTIPWLSARRA
ncbi:MAG: hypothetical protein ACLRSW_01445 [Christensenellaceae bacterium]